MKKPRNEVSNGTTKIGEINYMISGFFSISASNFFFFSFIQNRFFSLLDRVTICRFRALQNSNMLLWGLKKEANRHLSLTKLTGYYLQPSPKRPMKHLIDMFQCKCNDNKYCAYRNQANRATIRRIYPWSTVSKTTIEPVEPRINQEM